MRGGEGRRGGEKGGEKEEGRRMEEAPSGLLGQSKKPHGAVRSKPLLPSPCCVMCWLSRER